MFTLAFCALGFPLALRAQQQPTLEIDALSEEGGVVYDFATHTVTGTNGVIVRYGPTILTADRISANEDTGWALAEGKVHIQFETQIWTGEHIRYNYKTREMETQEFRTGMPRTAFATGRGLYGDVTNQVYFATNAVMTAEDYSNPLLKVRAKRIKVIPGEKFEAWHAVVYLGDVPIFYFPYYSRNLRKDANHFNFTPGYRSSYGAFILGGYTWIVDEQLDGIVHLDYRTKRGVGSGRQLSHGPLGRGFIALLLHARSGSQLSGQSGLKPERPAAPLFLVSKRADDQSYDQVRRALPDGPRHHPRFL
jgi:LPS-assembly protein